MIRSSYELYLHQSLEAAQATHFGPSSQISEKSNAPVLLSPRHFNEPHKIVCIATNTLNSLSEFYCNNNALPIEKQRIHAQDEKLYWLSRRVRRYLDQKNLSGQTTYLSKLLDKIDRIRAFFSYLKSVPMDPLLFSHVEDIFRIFLYTPQLPQCVEKDPDRLALEIVNRRIATIQAADRAHFNKTLNYTSFWILKGQKLDKPFKMKYLYLNSYYQFIPYHSFLEKDLKQYVSDYLISLPSGSDFKIWFNKADEYFNLIKNASYIHRTQLLDCLIDIRSFYHMLQETNQSLKEEMDQCKRFITQTRRLLLSNQSNFSTSFLQYCVCDLRESETRAFIQEKIINLLPESIDASQLEICIQNVKAFYLSIKRKALTTRKLAREEAVFKTISRAIEQLLEKKMPWTSLFRIDCIRNSLRSSKTTSYFKQWLANVPFYIPLNNQDIPPDPPKWLRPLVNKWRKQCLERDGIYELGLHENYEEKIQQDRLQFVPVGVIKGEEGPVVSPLVYKIASVLGLGSILQPTRFFNLAFLSINTDYNWNISELWGFQPYINQGMIAGDYLYDSEETKDLREEIQQNLDRQSIEDGLLFTLLFVQNDLHSDNAFFMRTSSGKFSLKCIDYSRCLTPPGMTYFKPEDDLKKVGWFIYFRSFLMTMEEFDQPLTYETLMKIQSWDIPSLEKTLGIQKVRQNTARYVHDTIDSVLCIELSRLSLKDRQSEQTPKRLYDQILNEVVNNTLGKEAYQAFINRIQSLKYFIEKNGHRPITFRECFHAVAPIEMEIFELYEKVFDKGSLQTRFTTVQEALEIAKEKKILSEEEIQAWLNKLKKWKETGLLPEIPWQYD